MASRLPYPIRSNSSPQSEADEQNSNAQPAHPETKEDMSSTLRYALEAVNKHVPVYKVGGQELNRAGVFEALFVPSVSRLQVIRKSRGLSQQALADAVSTNRAYITNIENGIRRPGRQMQKKLAGALMVSIDLLFPEY